MSSEAGVIFTLPQAIAAVNDKLQQNTWKRVFGSKVVTEVKEAGDYWMGESYHQVCCSACPRLDVRIVVCLPLLCRRVSSACRSFASKCNTVPILSPTTMRRRC